MPYEFEVDKWLLYKCSTRLIGISFGGSFPTPVTITCTDLSTPSFALFLGDVTCTVAELCENWPETLSIICIHLDDKRSGKNWYQLGIKIGIKGKALRKLQNPSEDSPADTVLRKIKTLKSDLLLTDMERDLKKLKIDKGTVEAIAIELHKFQGMKRKVPLINLSFTGDRNVLYKVI